MYTYLCIYYCYPHFIEPDGLAPAALLGAQTGPQTGGRPHPSPCQERTSEKQHQEVIT